MLAEADIALPAVVFVFLSEVAEKHPAPAYVFGGDVFFHCLDACFIAGFALFVDAGGDMQET